MASNGKRPGWVRLHERVAGLPTATHAAAAAVAVVANAAAYNVLDARYVASGYPVSYAEGQLAFSGQKIKEYLAHVVDLGTLNIYLQAQLIDYAFMITLAAVGILVPLLVRRAAIAPTLAFRLLTFAALLIPAGAFFDAIENLFSFPMIAWPATFPDFLAIPYSMAAAVKFFLLTTGGLAFLVGAVLTFVQAVSGRGRQVAA